MRISPFSTFLILKTMTKLEIVLLFISCYAIQQISSTTHLFEDSSDYYWREYTGTIPSDAIPGGTDRSGKPTYIGQMYKPSTGLLPATIYYGSKSALASSGRRSFTAETFVKILCSRNLEKYSWIPTKNEESHLLANCHLVIGGTESGFVLNIGRVNHEMETIIGKVFAHHTRYKGLTIPYKEKEVTYQTYEILTYDCDLNPCNKNHTDTCVTAFN